MKTCQVCLVRTKHLFIGGPNDTIGVCYECNDLRIAVRRSLVSKTKIALSMNNRSMVDVYSKVLAMTMEVDVKF